MKSLLLLSFFLSPVVFSAEFPTCSSKVFGGSVWSLEGQEPVQSKFRCDELEIECTGQGTKSEGWSFATRENKRILQFTHCSNSKTEEKPICVGDGTRSEGWQFPDGYLIYSNCSVQKIGCLFPGTNLEQWAAFQTVSIGNAFSAHCAE